MNGTDTLVVKGEDGSNVYSTNSDCGFIDWDVDYEGDRVDVAITIRDYASKLEWAQQTLVEAHAVLDQFDMVCQLVTTPQVTEVDRSYFTDDEMVTVYLNDEDTHVEYIDMGGVEL